MNSKPAVKKTLKLVFRKFKEGDIIAIFCNTAKDCKAGNVTAYQHMGQHCEVSRNIGSFAKLAKPEEYASLLRELKGIYNDYELIPVSRLVA